MAKTSWIFSLLLLLSLGACSSGEKPETTLIPEVVHELLGPSEFASILSQTNKFLLLDIRTPDEYETGHLKGAINLNFFDPGFHDSLQQLDKQLPVFIYSQNGTRSNKALTALKGSGFLKIYELEGGYEGMAL
ncbi:MAG: rhodanese-like domain-containing protein [Saprospiraceae bacterium]|nr:rhodanese-like domain-containing protein [Saprospiraceae bacterium]